MKSHDIRREDGPGVSVLKRHYVFILRPAKIFFAYLLHFYLLHLYPQVPQVTVEVYMKQNFSFFLCVHQEIKIEISRKVGNQTLLAAWINENFTYLSHGRLVASCDVINRVKRYSLSLYGDSMISFLCQTMRSTRGTSGSFAYLLWISFFISNTNSVFQAQAVLILISFFCPFEAKLFLCLFLDYREEYASLFHLDKFYCILQTCKNLFWKDLSLGYILNIF